MVTGDYDHDGQASEFLLQVGNAPCGKRLMALIGISRNQPHLHAFSSTAHPERPLVLQNREWAALLRANGPITIRDWECGDHGSVQAMEITLSARDGRISVHSRTFSCLENGSRGKVVLEQDE